MFMQVKSISSVFAEKKDEIERKAVESAVTKPFQVRKTWLDIVCLCTKHVNVCIKNVPEVQFRLPVLCFQAEIQVPKTCGMSLFLHA